MSSASSFVAVEVDGAGIVQFSSEFYMSDPSYCILEKLSKHRCPGHRLVPTRRVTLGGERTGRQFLGCPLDLPDECEWAVWVDPPPRDLVGRAFETLHDGIEASCLKAHRLERRVTHLREKKKKPKLEMKKMNGQMETWAVLMIIVGICILCYLFGSKNA
ncbi:hypothetical protein D1007_17796 [Hordeum vulgare]|nr:hypothetical protein D1007_17796 [Hordeum vulgare]